MNLPRLLFAMAACSGFARADGPAPLAIQTTGPGEFQLSWMANQLRPYQMECSPDLLEWSDSGPTVVGEGILRSMTVLKDGPQCFYRLREGAVRPGFDAIAMSRNDDNTYDEKTGPIQKVPLGFTVNYYGSSFSECYVNNNGNITFDAALGAYTPTPLGSAGQRIIAPFWADVDTRGPGSDVVRFSDNSITPRTLNGRAAFGVTYRNVGYYNQRDEKLNSFQVILMDRSDVAPGDFDIEFNYNRIRWESGGASGGINGYGGSPARAGVSNSEGSYVEYRGSGTSMAFIDSNPQTGEPNYDDGLIYQTYNSDCPGRILMQVRDGRIPEDFNVNAGADLNLDVWSGSTFQLNGSISPPETVGASYAWSQVSGPRNAQFATTATLTPSVMIPEPGEYVFKLTATRQGGDFLVTDTDTVRVSYPGIYQVYSGYYLLRHPDPLALTLNQTVATAPEGVSFTFQWTQMSGNAAQISDPTALTPEVTVPGPGYYEFRMTATTNHVTPFVFSTTAFVEYQQE